MQYKRMTFLDMLEELKKTGYINKEKHIDKDFQYTIGKTVIDYNGYMDEIWLDCDLLRFGSFSGKDIVYYFEDNNILFIKVIDYKQVIMISLS